MTGFEGLRVALVGPVPPPSGGMANQTRQLMGLLKDAGASVEMVATNAPYRPAWAERLPFVRSLFRLAPYLLALWRAAGRADLMHLMANSGWAWHLCAAPAIWVAHLRGCPVLVNYRGGEAAAFLLRSGRLVAFTLRRADALLVPSGFLQAVFARHGMPAEILPNVVDLQRFRPAPQLAAGAHLLVARNLEALYDNATAIRALALLRQHHPDARLTIAGTGPELARLQALVAELGQGEAVRFAGRLEREAMAELLRASTLCINPSLADNMPNSVLEALASGVPVLSTDVGGVPYLIEHERTALLVAPGDPAAMAAALRRLLDDAALRDRLREAGLAEVMRYTWARIGPQLSAFYRRSLNPSSSHRLARPS
ncbi:MAG TPA: glycosyltransferase family 4 protein [Burkholderiaceae bacterium]